ncbi:ArsR/SmtB family transcription factor [Micromonosporaceae bacterium DT194]|uniref:ArsR/SmtB family transcription factor n=1 Tax=Melissospora conviva TaxID=3388432 RepID=UPI003C169F19
MLRIFFSREDIARTRLAPAADPIWELVLSLHLLRGANADPMISGWRRRVGDRLRERAIAEQVRLFVAVNPPRGYFPDFLTPYQSVRGLDAGLEAIRSTPATRLRRDLTVLAGTTALPPSAAGLAEGESASLRELTGAMERYQAIAVDPYWSHICNAVEADRGVRARAMLAGGTEALLASLRPHLRWRSGELTVLNYPSSRELHLDGRGLLLVPSFFCAGTPVALFDPELPPVLVYPVERLGALPSTSSAPDPVGREALAALVGRTRALVLEALVTGRGGEGQTTSEVARRLQISAAAASQHTTVLRNAGLLVSRRERNMVVHTLTPLGLAILKG